MITVSKILDVEKYLEDVDVVLFDLDDTLYSEKEYVRSGFDAIAAEYPKVLCMGNKLWQAFLNGLPAIDTVLESEKLLMEKEKCLHIYRFHTPNIHFYPGVRSMIEHIKEIKRVGLITDGRPEGQRAKISALGLDLLMDKIIITDELGGIQYRKPSLESFILMKEFFNVEYEHMVYIGDNIKKDFIAPEELGIKTIYFSNPDSVALYSSKQLFIKKIET